jgi:hypothetical protein
VYINIVHFRPPVGILSLPISHSLLNSEEKLIFFNLLDFKDNIRKMPDFEILTWETNNIYGYPPKIHCHLLDLNGLLGYVPK